MGRKNRKRAPKISKYDVTKEEEPEEEDEEEIRRQQIDKYVDTISQIRLDMIKYCDDNGLPLCSNLNQDMLDYFIEFLKDNLI